MPDLSDYECYSDDWRRSNPDLVLHLPTETPASPEYVDHVLVEHTPAGALLAILDDGRDRPRPRSLLRAQRRRGPVLHAGRDDGRPSGPARPGLQLRLSRGQPQRAGLLLLQLVVKGGEKTYQRGGAKPYH